MKISKEKLKQIVREELASITENRNKFFIVDPTGMRGEPAYYRRKSTNDDSAFEFSTLFGATGFDDKGSANTTMRRIKNSSSKYKRATLKVLRGDELHEDISEAKVSLPTKSNFNLMLKKFLIIWKKQIFLIKIQISKPSIILCVWYFLKLQGSR